MLNQWEAFRLMTISGLLTTACVILFIFPMLRHKQNSLSDDPTKASNERTTLGSQINPRFFLGVNFSVIFVGMFLILLPCIGVLHLTGSLIAILSLALLAVLGLLYSSKKGDLGWLESFVNKENKG
jgi:NADH:ubiquinone oxidoreductase subunit 3 (subunit A)